MRGLKAHQRQLHTFCNAVDFIKSSHWKAKPWAPVRTEVPPMPSSGTIHNKILSPGNSQESRVSFPARNHTRAPENSEGQSMLHSTSAELKPTWEVWGPSPNECRGPRHAFIKNSSPNPALDGTGKEAPVGGPGPSPTKGKSSEHVFTRTKIITNWIIIGIAPYFKQTTEPKKLSLRGTNAPAPVWSAGRSTTSSQRAQSEKVVVVSLQ